MAMVVDNVNMRNACSASPFTCQECRSSDHSPFEDLIDLPIGLFVVTQNWQEAVLLLQKRDSLHSRLGVSPTRSCCTVSSS